MWQELQKLLVEVTSMLAKLNMTKMIGEMMSHVRHRFQRDFLAGAMGD